MGTIGACTTVIATWLYLTSKTHSAVTTLAFFDPAAFITGAFSAILTALDYH
jgi:hypothetical protein